MLKFTNSGSLKIRTPTPSVAAKKVKQSKNFSTFSKAVLSRSSIVVPKKVAFYAPKFQISLAPPSTSTMVRTFADFGGFDGQRRGGNRPPRFQVNTNVLLVRNMDNEDQLRNSFGEANITSIRAVRNPEGKFLGATFVEFENNEEAGKALDYARRVQRQSEEPSIVNYRPSSAQEREAAFKESTSPSTVVIVRRIPYAATEAEIERIFEGLKIDAITVGNGSAVIRFATPEDAEQALAKNGTDFARRSIIVSSGFGIDYEFAASKPPKVLRIRGAPGTAKEEEFREFFNGLDITRVDFTFREGISGRQVPGDVFVEFATPEEMQQALKLDRQNMGERYLQIFRSAARERKNRLLMQRQQQQQQQGAGGSNFQE